MKINRNIVGVGIAVVGAALFLFALNQSPGAGALALGQTSVAVQIPQELKLAFTGLLYALVTVGFTWLLNQTGLDLTGIATPLAGTLSAFLIGLAQQWIDVQPITSDAYIRIVLNILVVIIGGIPMFLLMAKRSLTGYKDEQ